MRIENRENNMYTKLPDRVEGYLIRIVNRFFENDIINIQNSKEAIINEAINRFKEDGMDINSLKVIDHGTIDIHLSDTDKTKNAEVNLTGLNLKNIPKFLAFHVVSETNGDRAYSLPVMDISEDTFAINSIIKASATKTSFTVKVSRNDDNLTDCDIQILYYILI